MQSTMAQAVLCWPECHTTRSYANVCPIAKGTLDTGHSPADASTRNATLIAVDVVPVSS